MILRAEKDGTGVFQDLNTGRSIGWVIWADMDSGVFEAYVCDTRSGLPVWPHQTYKGQTRLRFLPMPKPTKPRAEKPTIEPRGTRIVATSLNECEVRCCHEWADWIVQDYKEELPEVAADGLSYSRASVTTQHYFCNEHFRNPVRETLRGVESEVLVLARPQ